MPLPAVRGPIVWIPVTTMLNWNIAALLSTGLIAVAAVTFGIVGAWRPFRRTSPRASVPGEHA
ncbi:hypothetical protein [Streptomyces sp. NPDC002952]|uniref:hypothetical protein n=1 Tax=Streptomyces sp. NPDC002952 TaxID=3364673 RepID=UPI00368EF1A3